MTLDEIISAIHNGVADNQEERIYTALKHRRKFVDVTKGSSFSAGDVVKFNDNASPKYLRGAAVTILQVGKTTATVQVPADGFHGDWKGRFRPGSNVQAPFGIIDLVKKRGETISQIEV